MFPLELILSIKLPPCTIKASAMMITDDSHDHEPLFKPLAIIVYVTFKEQNRNPRVPGVDRFDQCVAVFL
jgi:hypothetical protein